MQYLMNLLKNWKNKTDMEQTIEERAYNLYPVYRAIVNGRNIDTNEDRRRAFITTATEQKRIDIDKACSWLRQHAISVINVEAFRKAMEK